MKNRMIVAYSSDSTYTSTTLDFLTSFSKFPEFDIDYIAVTGDRKVDIDAETYDVLVQSYCARWPIDGYVSPHFAEFLKNFKGIKVLIVQDEYEETNKLKNAIKAFQYDIVMTCVPRDQIQYVYPREEFGETTFITVFTGYVPDDFALKVPEIKPLAERPIVLGYRGNDIGGRYGRLGFDKYEIGRRMREICVDRGVSNDIAMDAESRIYGKKWFEFIASCRAMLGSESGSNVFDFDGEIRRRFEVMTLEKGERPSYAEFLPHVSHLDGAIEMGQISPRVFECALCRTAMVLFRGRYSGVLVPDVHYIALEKDFSNVDDVLLKLEDIPLLEEMTSRCYDELVASGAYGYGPFHAKINEAIRVRAAQRAIALDSKALGRSPQVFDFLPFEAGTFVNAATRLPLDAAHAGIVENWRQRDFYVSRTEGLLDYIAQTTPIYEGEICRLLDAHGSAATGNQPPLLAALEHHRGHYGEAAGIWQLAKRLRMRREEVARQLKLLVDQSRLAEAGVLVEEALAEEQAGLETINSAWNSHSASYDETYKRLVVAVTEANRTLTTVERSKRAFYRRLRRWLLLKSKR